MLHINVMLPFDTILFSVDHMQSVRASASKHPMDYKRKYLGIKRMVKQLVFVCIVFYFSYFFWLINFLVTLVKKIILYNLYNTCER